MNFRIPDFPLGALLATTLCGAGLLFISPETSSMWLWEILIAISVVVWALGSGFLAKETRIEDESKVFEQSKNENGNDTRVVSADIAALINTIHLEGKYNRKEERKEDAESRIREQISIVFIGITMFAIILQVHEMVKAYEPIHDQAKAAADQAKAAIEQARAATIQAEGSKDTAIAAGRAWVGPNDATISNVPPSPQQVSIVVTYQNTGREPATDFVSTADAFVANDEKSFAVAQNRATVNMKACKNQKTIDESQVVFPSTGFGSSSLKIVLPKESVPDDPSGDKTVIAVTGCFAYKTFRTVHHTSYCFFYSKETSQLPHMNFCPGGSYAD